jgi:hypothetical protein
MLIHNRPYAITAAVISFFGLSFAGVFKGLTPLICCKRALIGAAVAYFACSIAVAIIDAVITKAIVDGHVNKQFSPKTGKAKA